MSLFKKLFGKKHNEEGAVPPPSQSPPPSTPASKPLQIREITPNTLKSQLDNGSVNNLIVVDMRAQWEYQAGHIPGAINMFIQEIPARFKELPKDGNIVFQCWHGNTSLDASAFLIQQGWPEPNVASLSGGMAGWVQVHGQESLTRG